MRLRKRLWPPVRSTLAGRQARLPLLPSVARKLHTPRAYLPRPFEMLTAMQTRPMNLGPRPFATTLAVRPLVLDSAVATLPLVGVPQGPKFLMLSETIAVFVVLMLVAAPPLRPAALAPLLVASLLVEIRLSSYSILKWISKLALRLVVLRPVVKLALERNKSQALTLRIRRQTEALRKPSLIAVRTRQDATVEMPERPADRPCLLVRPVLEAI